MNECNKFEDWFKRELNKHANFSTHMGVYLDVGVSVAWKAWRASAQRESYKLVPLDATDKMSLRGYHALERFVSMAEVDILYKAMIGVVDE